MFGTATVKAVRVVFKNSVVATRAVFARSLGTESRTTRGAPASAASIRASIPSMRPGALSVCSTVRTARGASWIAFDPSSTRGVTSRTTSPVVVMIDATRRLPPTRSRTRRKIG